MNRSYIPSRFLSREKLFLVTEYNKSDEKHTNHVDTMKVANGNCVAAKSRHQHVQDRSKRHLVHKYERMATNTKEHEQKKEIILFF